MLANARTLLTARPRWPHASTVAVCALIWCLYTPTPAQALLVASEPAGVLAEVVLPISGPSASSVFFGYIGEDDDGDLYSFLVTEATTATIRLDIPAWPEHAQFRPDLYLQAAGSRPVHIQDPGGTRPAEFDVLALASLWAGAELEYGFEPGVQYVVRVDPGEGATTSGRYALRFDTDTPTPTSLQTVFDLPGLWFGTYGGAPQRFNPLAVVPFLGILFVIGGLGALLRGVRRHARRSRRSV